MRDALLDGLPPHRLLPLHRKAAEGLRGLDASPARIGHQLVQAGDVGAATQFLLQAARTDAAIGAYRDALALIDAVRQDVRDPERGPMLALHADMLMATGDAGAVLAYREALGATDARTVSPPRRSRWRSRRHAHQLVDAFLAQVGGEAVALSAASPSAGPSPPAAPPRYAPWQ